MPTTRIVFLSAMLFVNSLYATDNNKLAGIWRVQSVNVDGNTVVSRDNKSLTYDAIYKDIAHLNTILTAADSAIVNREASRLYNSFYTLEYTITADSFIVTKYFKDGRILTENYGTYKLEDGNIVCTMYLPSVQPNAENFSVAKDAKRNGNEHIPQNLTRTMHFSLRNGHLYFISEDIGPDRNHQFLANVLKGQYEMELVKGN